VPAGRVHEELERVQRAAARGGERGPRRSDLGAHDHVALLERGPQRGDVVLGELVLVGECLEVLFLDEAALRGLFDQALGRRQVMQMNRVVQLNPSLGRGEAAGRRPPRRPGAGANPRFLIALVSDL